MKYGKFVPETKLAMSQAEIEAFEGIFKSLVNLHKGLQYMGCENNAYGTGSVTFKFSIPNAHLEGRDIDGNRFTFKGLSFLCYKSKGYLDKTNWLSGAREIVKDYDNAPEYQYEVYMVCHGTTIPYRGRRSQPLEVAGHFDYDTEIHNFTFEKGLKTLFKNILGGHCIKVLDVKQQAA